MPSVVPYHSNSENDDESETGSESPVNHIDENFIDDELEEIQADDFPSYFNEIDGRLFPSCPSSPYPLPVDTPEQEVNQIFSIFVHSEWPFPSDWEPWTASFDGWLVPTALELYLGSWRTTQIDKFMSSICALGQGHGEVSLQRNLGILYHLITDWVGDISGWWILLPNFLRSDLQESTLVPTFLTV